MYLYGTDLSAEKASWKHQMWGLKCSSLVRWYKNKNTRAIWLLLTGSAELSSGEHSNAGERIVSVFAARLADRCLSVPIACLCHTSLGSEAARHNPYTRRHPRTHTSHTSRPRLFRFRLTNTKWSR